jgi:hypothetical protein
MEAGIVITFCLVLSNEAFTYLCAKQLTFILFTFYKNFQKMSKKLFILPLFLFGAFLLTTTTSCGDKCATLDCVNGTCLDGTCECDPGYEADSKGICNTEVRAKFLGSYTVNENCSKSGQAAPYFVGVTSGSGISDVSLSGFYGPVSTGGFIAAVKATVDGTTINIARQQPDNDNIFVVGSGSISGTVMTITYTVSDETGTPIVSNTCSNVTFTR